MQPREFFLDANEQIFMYVAVKLFRDNLNVDLDSANTNERNELLDQIKVANSTLRKLKVLLTDSGIDVSEL